MPMTHRKMSIEVDNIFTLFCLPMETQSDSIRHHCLMHTMQHPVACMFFRLIVYTINTLYYGISSTGSRRTGVYVL